MGCKSDYDNAPRRQRQQYYIYTIHVYPLDIYHPMEI